MPSAGTFDCDTDGIYMCCAVLPCRLPVVATPEQVYNSVDADTVLTVLTHKITRAVRSQVGTQSHVRPMHECDARCTVPGSLATSKF